MRPWLLAACTSSCLIMLGQTCEAAGLIRVQNETRHVDTGWVPIASPYHDTDHFATACAWDPVRDKIYMYGGIIDYGTFTLDSSLYRYDPIRDTWETMAPMLNCRCWVKGLYCHGKLYVMGGATPQLGITNECEAYDIESNTWTRIADMPMSNLGYPAVVWRDSLIYVLGGRGSGEFTDSAALYDPARDRWLLCSRTRDTLNLVDACLIGDTIYVAGTGMAGTGSPRPMMIRGAIDPADPTHITWSDGPILPSDSSHRYGPTLALGDKVYFFGGYQTPQSGNPSVSARGWVYDPRHGSFDTLPWLPAVTGGTVIFSFGVARDAGGEIYKLAGDDHGDRVGPNRTYYKYAVPHTRDIMLSIGSPRDTVDSNTAFVPTALLTNRGFYGEHVNALRFRVEGLSFDSSGPFILRALQDTTLAFDSVPVNLPAGSHVVSCTVMGGLAADTWSRAGQDTVVIRAFDAEVRDLNPPDTLVSDTFTPRATVWNRWPRAGSVEVTCCICRNGELAVYSESESIYLAVGDSQRITFPTWSVTSGWYQAKVFVSHGGVVLRDTARKGFQAYGYDALITSLNLLDTLAAGSFIPVATILNYGRLPGWISVPWRIFRDDTLRVYAQTESTYLEAGANRQLRFPSWGATNGSYLAKVFATHNGLVLRDTTRRRFVVASGGLAESGAEPLPTEYSLDIVSPNPSRDGRVAILYSLPQAGPASIKLYDATGRVKRTLVEAIQPAGRYSVSFDTRTSSFVIPPGVYFIRLTSPNCEKTRKAVVTE